MSLFDVHVHCWQKRDTPIRIEADHGTGTIDLSFGMDLSVYLSPDQAQDLYERLGTELQKAEAIRRLCQPAHAVEAALSGEPFNLPDSVHDAALTAARAKIAAMGT